MINKKEISWFLNKILIQINHKRQIIYSILIIPYFESYDGKILKLKLCQRSYTFIKTIFMIYLFNFVSKKEYSIISFHLKHKIHVVYITNFFNFNNHFYPF